MYYEETGIYRVSDVAYSGWINNPKDTVNKCIAKAVGVGKWSPCDFDPMGRVTSLIMVDTGKKISTMDVTDRNGHSVTCLFTRDELENGKVLHVGNVSKEVSDDRYVVMEYSPSFESPSIASKNNKNVFTLEEAKALILELMDIVPDNVHYELFKTAGKAEVKVIKTVEVK